MRSQYDVRADDARLGQRRILLSPRRRRTCCIARRRGRACSAVADDAEQRQVVLQRRDAGARGVADHLADVVDLAIALGALAEQDVRILSPGDAGWSSSAAAPCRA